MNSSTAPKLKYSDVIRIKMKTGDNPTGRPITMRMAEQMMRKPSGEPYSYEHIRKVVTGDSVQSRDMNDEFCRILGLDPDDMWLMAQQEKAQRKFGPALQSMIPPPDKALKGLWSALTESDKLKVKQLVEALADANTMQHRAWRHAS